MNKAQDHIMFKLTAKLLLVSSFLCILFGSGLHIHPIFDHGELHAAVHAHSSDVVTTGEMLSEDSPSQHQVSSVELTGVLSHNQKTTVDSPTTLVFSSVFAGLIYYPQKQPLTLFDLPPPKHVPTLYHLSSFSLRGPPVV